MSSQRCSYFFGYLSLDVHIKGVLLKKKCISIYNDNVPVVGASPVHPNSLTTNGTHSPKRASCNKTKTCYQTSSVYPGHHPWQPLSLHDIVQVEMIERVSVCTLLCARLACTYTHLHVCVSEFEIHFSPAFQKLRHRRTKQ